MANDNYFLQPGYIIVPEQATTISTVTGSSVMVCLFDKKKLIAGFNHFQLPHIKEKGKTTAVYGNVATTTLIKMMCSRGSKAKHLEAQLFGGAFNREKSDRDIGKKNVEAAKRVLKKYRINLISEDTGGEKGRKIVFNTHTNEAAVLKVDSLRDNDWYPYR